MPRIYLPLEVDFDDDDKVARLARYEKPGEARACRDLLVSMWRYCKRNTTDGHVPLEQLGKLVYPDSPKIGRRDAERLVEIGIAERTEDGYYLPGYLKRNKSRAQLGAEAAIKAEAGRKGGKRSGEVRRTEAHREAPDEAPDEAERSTSLPTSEAIDRDIDRDKNNSGTTQEGERPETLRPLAATPPPPDDGPRCSRHPNGNPTDQPCAGCARVREKRDQAEAREAERRAVELERARLDCPGCEGTGKVLDPDTKLPTRQTCTHPHTRRTA